MGLLHNVIPHTDRVCAIATDVARKTKGRHFEAHVVIFLLTALNRLAYPRGDPL